MQKVLCHHLRALQSYTVYRLPCGVYGNGQGRQMDVTAMQEEWRNGRFEMDAA